VRRVRSSFRDGVPLAVEDVPVPVGLLLGYVRIEKP
jgi:hypothetical protein